MAGTSATRVHPDGAVAPDGVRFYTIGVGGPSGTFEQSIAY